MNSLEEIRDILRSHKQDLRMKYHVKELGVFGSFARGEESNSSDVDILVDFDEPIGWEYIDLIAYLESILGMKVDLVTPMALKRQIKDNILKELVSV
jgi:predicted nucleotidyltransferase